MMLDSTTFQGELDQPVGGRLALSAGAADVVAGFKAWRLWTMLGWSDIVQRYRRSALGPLWITLSMAIFIVVLGVIYSRIFKLDIATYLPYVAMGVIAWGFMSGTTAECCATFIENGAIIKQINLPFTLYVLQMRMASRHYSARTASC